MRKKFPLSAPVEYYRRQYDEPFPAHPYRSEFQRDRDRILYSRQFRRVSGKTQVFLTASHDHIRTRLTHTLEVAQIARVTVKCLGLDQALVEAIALAHDAGHTPFGHAGEKALSLIMSCCDEIADFQHRMEEKDMGFKHNLQGLRVTCDLERLSGEFPGLNLTNFTLWGVKNHTKSQWGPCPYTYERDDTCIMCYLKHNPQNCSQQQGQRVGFYDKYEKYLTIPNEPKEAWSLEGEIVKNADEIAQRHHDIEDAIFMGVITKEELIDQIGKLVLEDMHRTDRKKFEKLKSTSTRINDNLFLPLISTLIVGFLNKKLIISSRSNLDSFMKEYEIKNRKNFIDVYPQFGSADVSGVISFPDELVEKEERFHQFLKNRILNSFEVQRMDGKGRFVIRRLFKAYLKNPHQLHDATINYIFRIYNPEHKAWPTPNPTEIGEMRDGIDKPTKKAEAYCVGFVTT